MAAKSKSAASKPARKTTRLTQPVEGKRSAPDPRQSPRSAAAARVEPSKAARLILREEVWRAIAADNARAIAQASARARRRGLH